MSFRSDKKRSQNVSLNDAIETDKNGNELTMMDVIAAPDTIAEDIDLKMQCERLRKEVDLLEGREAIIIRLRYGLDNTFPLTQRQIAVMLGISRSYVSELAYYKW